VELEESGVIADPVLDAGCGTGENSLYLASRGHAVLGVDGAPAAVATAHTKADERGLQAEFVEGDALDVATLGKAFSTVIDVGFFHSLSDEARVTWAEQLRAVLSPGGRYHMLCFSEHAQVQGGPRRITQAEIRDTFADGFAVTRIRAYPLSSRFGEVAGWLATVERV
jgi:cyclopropane fatty-acyl-phospholipid synthase-like methyltransferase